MNGTPESHETMELPEDVLHIIREFAKPCCRLDWRQGSFACRHYPSPIYFKQEIAQSIKDWHERNYDWADYILWLLESIV